MQFATLKFYRYYVVIQNIIVFEDMTTCEKYNLIIGLFSNYGMSSYFINLSFDLLMGFVFCTTNALLFH